MAIAVDGTPSSTFTNGGASSMSWSHTTSGTNRALYVVVLYDFELSSSPTGVTYNSVAMTSVATTSSSHQGISIWQLVAPATGSNTIVVTASATDMLAYAAGISFTGVDQSTPSGTAVVANDVGVNINTSLTVSSATGEIVLGGCQFRLGGGTCIYDSAGTEFDTTVGESDQIVGSFVYLDGASSVAVNWHWSTGDGRENVAAAIPIKPVASAANWGQFLSKDLNRLVRPIYD